jgi:lysophospholipase L1-like esterase
MRRTAVFVAFLLLAVTRAASGAEPPYYLALGDSLAQGVQPLPNHTLVNTNQGYVDSVYAYYRLRHPQLQLAKLGCSGESTTTMRFGLSNCKYSKGSQLEDAKEFLHTHRVLFVTLTIGGDDELACVNPANTLNPIDAACLVQGTTAIETNLPEILKELRDAAGPNVPIIGSNYYDPFVAAVVLLPGVQGQMLANDSLQIALDLNARLANRYSDAGMPVADVARAFRMTDFANVPGFNIPLNAFLALTWTWIGAPPPRGPDVHPNAAGYVVIASAFIRTIGPI